MVEKSYNNDIYEFKFVKIEEFHHPSEERAMSEWEKRLNSFVFYKSNVTGGTANTNQLVNLSSRSKNE